VVVPVGSNTHTLPFNARVRRVARNTSGFVDVDTTGPVCDNNAGMITALVFPDRGGPSNRTARSPRANRGWPDPTRPRYTPPPACQQAVRAARSGSVDVVGAVVFRSRWNGVSSQRCTLAGRPIRAMIARITIPVTIFAVLSFFSAPWVSPRTATATTTQTIHRHENPRLRSS
jgi:hypothetical protein